MFDIEIPNPQTAAATTLKETIHLATASIELAIACLRVIYWAVILVCSLVKHFIDRHEQILVPTLRQKVWVRWWRDLVRPTTPTVSDLPSTPGAFLVLPQTTLGAAADIIPARSENSPLATANASKSEETSPDEPHPEDKASSISCCPTQSPREIPTLAPVPSTDTESALSAKTQEKTTRTPSTIRTGSTTKSAKTAKTRKNNANNAKSTT
ncbi:MAG: hypothetical protein KME17_23840 [Cyanosarcina radialis HA8281-LM2]|jgi:hypothetical protein|nr:hypothetical protein [Cyanosarcina radialis HA8281-LM2]